jgi:hypothetical protein
MKAGAGRLVRVLAKLAEAASVSVAREEARRATAWKAEERASVRASASTAEHAAERRAREARAVARVVERTPASGMVVTRAASATAMDVVVMEPAWEVTMATADGRKAGVREKAAAERRETVERLAAAVASAMAMNVRAAEASTETGASATVPEMWAEWVATREVLRVRRVARVSEIEAEMVPAVRMLTVRKADEAAAKLVVRAAAWAMMVRVAVGNGVGARAEVVAVRALTARVAPVRVAAGWEAATNETAFVAAAAAAIVEAKEAVWVEALAATEMEAAEVRGVRTVVLAVACQEVRVALRAAEVAASKAVSYAVRAEAKSRKARWAWRRAERRRG